MSEPDGADSAVQRRYLTVWFADLSDSTRLGATLEAEDYAQLLGEVRSLTRAVVARHGGLIARMQGDGVLAIFGSEQTREDDGRRATEAALELAAQVERLPAPPDLAPGQTLSMHSGIHAGLVLVGRGDVEIGRLELLGDVPNIAARLSALAGPGEVLVSEATLGPEAGYFEVLTRQSTQIRGRERPLVVLTVGRRATVPRRFDAQQRRGEAPFVGRVAELAVLHAALARAATGQCSCVAVHGVAGLGKTRLIEQFLRSAMPTQAQVMRGYCEGYLAAEPLQPFLQILRGVAGVTPELDPATAMAAAQGAAALQQAVDTNTRAVLLQALTAAGAHSAVAQSALLRLLEGLATQAMAHSALVLVLDDWQWADDASQAMLGQLQTLAQPLLVLIAHRDSVDQAPRWPNWATAIALQPFEQAEGCDAVSRLLPGVHPFAAAQIHNYGGGVPLFIEELCHNVAAGEGQSPLARAPSGAAWLATLVESRVARLPHRQLRIVRMAAVLGVVFPAWLLQRLTGHAADDPLVTDLAARDLIFDAEQPGMLRFKHGLTRDVIYDTVGLHERRQLHLQIAQLLAYRRPPPANPSIADAGGAAAQPASRDWDLADESLAYHYAAAGQHRLAADHAERAGDKAMAAQALDRTRSQYAATLAALDALPELDDNDCRRWCAVAQRLGMTDVFDPFALPDGVGLFERGVALAERTGDIDVMARAEYWLCYVLYAKGQHRRADRHGQRALALCRQSGEPRLLAQVVATVGQNDSAMARYDAALLSFDAALQSKRSSARPGSGVAIGSAYTLSCKGSLLGDRGLFDQADECFDEVLALLGDTTHHVLCSVYNWISTVHQWRGRWTSAVTYAARGMQVAERNRSGHLLAMARMLWGHADWTLSGREGSYAAVQDGTRWIEQRNGALLTSLNYGYLLRCGVARGQTDDLRRMASLLLRRARQGDMLGLAMGYRALADHAVARHQWPRAARCLDLADNAAARRGAKHEVAVTALHRAKLAAQHDQAGLARRWLDTAVLGFESMGMDWYMNQARALDRDLGGSAGG